MERLSSRDLIMLWPGDTWPQEIGVLAILDGSRMLDSDGRFSLAAVQEVIEGRLHLVPRFRQILHTPRRGLGRPLWVNVPAVSIQDHVRAVAVSAPGDEAQMLAVVEQLRRRPLDRSRPLWEVWFITGLPEQRVGLYAKVHHAIADGVAAMAAFQALLDNDGSSAAAPARAWTPESLPSACSLFVDNIGTHFRRFGRAFAVRPRAAAGRARAVWPALREMVTADERVPRTSLDRLVGADRTVVLVRSRLDALTTAAHAHNATVNDVLLAVTAAGLRTLTHSRGESMTGDALRAYVYISLRGEARGQTEGNLVAQMVVPLATDEPDPGLRLRRIAATTARRKAAPRPSVGTVFGNRVTRRVILAVMARQRVNVTVANVPGPSSQLHLAGAPLLEMFPVVPLAGRLTLGIGAVSYAGQFTMSVVADRDSYPDIDVFVAGFRDGLESLGASAETEGVR